MYDELPAERQCRDRTKVNDGGDGTKAAILPWAHHATTADPRVSGQQYFSLRHDGMITVFCPSKFRSLRRRTWHLSCLTLAVSGTRNWEQSWRRKQRSLRYLFVNKRRCAIDDAGRDRLSLSRLALSRTRYGNNDSRGEIFIFCRNNKHVNCQPV